MKKTSTIINGFVCNTLYTKKRIQKNIKRLANVIYNDYKNKKDIVLLMVMNGGLDFGLDLSRALEKRGLKHSRETITATRYTRDGKETNRVRIFHKGDLQIAGKNVIVIEDLIDKGITLEKLYLYLKNKTPKSLNFAVLGIKEDHTFTGKIMYKLIEEPFPDLWLFGYGMDWREEFRSLTSILYNTEEKAKHS